MDSNKHSFVLGPLDHVAILVQDLQASADWYKQVLGLRPCQPPEWQPYPVFMLSGQTGVALFPADLNDSALPVESKNIKIDHFAFRVSNEAFSQARKHYDTLELSYTFRDHTYFHSIYTKDPDGHTVELTTLVVEASTFYG